MYTYGWLIHVDVWQKPTQHCKAIICQLKIKRRKKRECLRGQAQEQAVWMGTTQCHPGQVWVCTDTFQ